MQQLPINHHHELYVDIDALFDVRLACLEELSPDLALLNLTHGWEKRIADAPLGLSEQDFRHLYNHRDTDTLSLAVQTPVFEVVRHWILEAIKKLGEIPADSTLALCINFFPYRMPKETAQEVAQKIKDALKVNVQIELLNLDPQQITPTFVKRRFDGMIMYDGIRWINSQAQAFEKDNCPQTTLYVPGFFCDHLPTTEEIQEASQESKNIFRDMEVSLGPMVAVEFLPISVFSSVIPPQLAELRQREKAEGA